MQRALALIEGAGQRLLDQSRALIQPHWAMVHSRLSRGEPVKAIVGAATKDSADLIMMGSKGFTEFGPFLMGSVARRIVLGASCPVLVVKTRSTRLRHVLMCVDGSTEAAAAVDYVLRWPLSPKARGTIVSVVPQLPVELLAGSTRMTRVLNELRAVLEEGARQVIQQTSARMYEDGFEVTTVVRHGQPAAELVRVAESVQADVLVVGSRGLGGTAFLLGSVSDAVVKYAPCSVLVWRQRAR